MLCNINSGLNSQIPKFHSAGANGWRYPLVDGTRRRRFAGTDLKPHKLPENAQTPTSRVHLGMMAGDHFPRENILLSTQGEIKSCGF